MPGLDVIRRGDSPRFLFVHGANGSATCWDGVAEALWHHGVSCWALSLRGHGRSEGGAHLQEWGIRDYVVDVREVLSSLTTPPVLVGHSMGGLVCQLTAAEAPVAGLVLIASSPVGGMMRDGARMSLHHPFTFLGAMLRRSFAYLYRREEICRKLLFTSDTAPEIVRAFHTQVQEESWRAGNEMQFLLPDPAKVTCPVMVIGGGRDFMVSPQSVRGTAEAYGVSPVFLPEFGHMIPLECPPERLRDLLITFP